MSLDVLVRYFLIPGIGLWAFWRLCIEARGLWRETKQDFQRPRRSDFENDRRINGL